MDEESPFIKECKSLIDCIQGTSFADCQYAYRKLVYRLALDILQRFPDEALGPDPSQRGSADVRALSTTPVGRPAGGNSGGPGGHPSIVCKLGCLVADLVPVDAS